MLPRRVLQRAPCGPGLRPISTRTGQSIQHPLNFQFHGLNNNYNIPRKQNNINQNVLRKQFQPRSLTTEAIPTIAIPPLMFIGLLLSLWTWKCFWIIVMQNKLLYLSWLPPFTRSEEISDYEIECRPVQWEEKQIRSLDGTKLAVCEGHISLSHIMMKQKSRTAFGPAITKTQNQGSTRKKSVVICYFQGNGGSTPMRLPLLSHVLRAITETTASISSPMSVSGSEATEYTIVALSYRGYWKSSGRATQSGIEKDAQAFLNWVSTVYADPETDLEIVIWGHSLGAAVATSAVSTYLSRRDNQGSDERLAPISRVILEAPTSSIKDMLVSLYPQKWLPYRYLGPFSWNNWDIKTDMRQLARWRDRPVSQTPRSESACSMPRLLPPIFLLSAEKDEVIPSYVPGELLNHARSLGLQIEAKNVPGAMHIEAPLKLDGRKAMVQFILHGHIDPYYENKHKDTI